MATIYSLLNADAKAWWYHKQLRDHGQHDEARAKERESIKRHAASLRNARYVSVGRGGHTVHERPVVTKHGSSTCRVQGYESSNGPTVQAAIRLGVPVIDTTTVSDRACYDLIALPMPAESDEKADSGELHGMSYCTLAYYAGLAAALGATVHNVAVDKAAAQARASALPRAARRAPRGVCQG